MNANELTALISECLRETDDHKFFLKLESVLRQQQAEIEALKAHPVKELTDEEIHKVAQEHFHAGLGINPLDFARAILRKAQEK